MAWSYEHGSDNRLVKVRSGLATRKEPETAAQGFATGPLQKLDQAWVLLVGGVLLLASAVVLVFLVFYQ